MIDLLVRGGLVHDGTGLPPYRADVAVEGQRVAAIGGVGREAADGLRAARVIDADGLAVAPGFIDIHTHLDAQLSWDHCAIPMLEHGVTTVVTGNCSLSLAPLRAAQRERLARMFEQIEQVPFDALDCGIDWAWEDFPQWLDHQEPRLGINLAPLVGHSALRMWVMGDDAHERAATEAEVDAMCRTLAAALAAGAVGLSISHIDVDEHRRPVPSRLADAKELRRLGATLGAGGAMLQAVPEYWDLDAMLQRVEGLAELSIATGAPATFSPLIDQTPGLVDTVLEAVEGVWRRGARVFPQVQPAGSISTSASASPALPSPACGRGARCWPLATGRGQLSRFSDPATRQVLVEAAYVSADAKSRARLEATYVSAVGRQGYQGLVGRRLSDLAAERGCNPAEAMLDIAVADGLETRFTRPATSNTDTGLLSRLVGHPAVLIGASDAGAHVRSFSTYGDTAVLFRQFVRAEGALSVEEAVRRLTTDPSRAWGLGARGQLHRGAPADLVVFDPDTIDVGPDLDVADLPAGRSRYLRRAVGTQATIVNGQVAWTAEEGYTGVRSGQVVSGRRRQL